jgi:hypothetical protein
MNGMRGKVKMETITRTKGTITKVTTEMIYLQPLKDELIEIEKQLVDLEKEPDEVLVPNDEKFLRISQFKDRIFDINKILNEKEW